MAFHRVIEIMDRRREEIAQELKTLKREEIYLAASLIAQEAKRIADG
ncbi:MAG: hypothetical protein JWP25_8985 [Bradyrhizobium sp.]|nr:hypothetical protein [Bradyrhizobium sp.]